MAKYSVGNRSVAAIVACSILLCLAPGFSYAQQPPFVAAPADGHSSEAASEKEPEPPPEAISPSQARTWHGVHPRLLFTRADLQKIQRQRHLLPEAYGLLLKRADAHLLIAVDDLADHRSQMPHILPRLALAGIISENPNYTAKAIKLLMAQLQDANTLSDVQAARLLTAMSLAYDWTYHRMTADERRTAARKLGALGQQFNLLMNRRESALGQLMHLPNVAGHHRLAQAAGGLGLTMLAVRGEANFDIIASGMATADLAARSYLRQAFGADGAGIEGFDATLEALGGLLPYLLARNFMDRVDLSEGSALATVPSWFVYEFAAGSAMLPLGESGRPPLAGASALALLEPVAADARMHRWFVKKLLGKEDWKALADDNADPAADIWAMLCIDAELQPRPPDDHLPLVKLFPSRGIGYARSGWMSEGGDTIVTFNCPSQPHLGLWQLDANQFTYQAYGVGWAIDSGPGRQSVGNRQMLTLRSHSQGHNLMEIDGAGQVRPFGRMLAFHDEPDWLVAIGDGAESYGLKTFNRMLIAGKRDGRVRYIIIVDEIEPADDARHLWRHFLHTAAGNKVVVDGPTAKIEAPSGATALYAIIAPADLPDLAVADFPPDDAAAHPRIEMRHHRAGGFTMVSLLVADPTPQAAPASADAAATADHAPADNGPAGNAAADTTPADSEPDQPQPAPAVVVIDHVGPAVAFRLRVDGLEDRVCILTQHGAKPPEGYGSDDHRLQLKNAQAAKTLLFDFSQSGHQAPSRH